MKSLCSKFVIYALCTSMLLGTVLIMTGCNGQNASAEDVGFLTGVGPWYHYDEVTGENEKMRFSDDFTFYWGCECGEPIGNSDCYELFDYDKETSMIKLYNDYDDMSMELEVLDYSDYYLLLKVDGEIKGYTSGETGVELVESEKYLSGYSGEFFFLEGNEEEILLAPFDYDGDVEYPENAFRTYPFAADAEFYTLFTYTQIKDGEVMEDKVEYEEIDIEKALHEIEYGAGGFVWFDDEMKVSKIVIYGATVVEE